MRTNIQTPITKKRAKKEKETTFRNFRYTNPGNYLWKLTQIHTDPIIVLVYEKDES